MPMREVVAVEEGGGDRSASTEGEVREVEGGEKGEGDEEKGYMEDV